MCSDIPVDMWGKERHQTPYPAQHPRETADPRETAGFALQLLDTYSQKGLSAIHDPSFYFPKLIVATEI